LNKNQQNLYINTDVFTINPR